MSMMEPQPVADEPAAAVVLRDAAPDDVRAIRAIYAGHVLGGTGTFEEMPPEDAAMAARLDAIRAHRLPFLVAHMDGTAVGFAYASYFRPRSAYRYTVEDSVYVHPDVIGCGVGRRLLGELIERCEALGYRQMVAVIGDSANHRSIGLHAALGFRPAGTLASVGFKFGGWLDVVFMQRALGSGDTTLPHA